MKKLINKMYIIKCTKLFDMKIEVFRLFSKASGGISSSSKLYLKQLIVHNKR